MSWRQAFAGVCVNAQTGPDWPATWAGVCAGMLEKRLRLIFTSYGHDVRFRNADKEMLRAIRLSLASLLFGDTVTFKDLTESEACALFTFLDAPGSSEALAAWMEEMGWLWTETS